MFFAKWRLIMMKPINDMTDEEVIEELSGYKSSADIDLTDIKKARHLLHILRATFAIEDDDEDDI